MPDLRSLSRADLLAATFRLAVDERRITLSVLEHFREIERCKAYSDLGYKSLYEYAITHLKYSEGSTSRRIAAMYALKENPELGERIKAGETSVTSVARIHTTIRRDEKLTARKWKSSEKAALFQEMGPLPMRALEKGLVALAPAAALTEKIRPVTAELHEVKVYLTTEDLEALEELRGTLAHSLGNPGSPSELFRKLIAIARESVDKRQRGAARASSEKRAVRGEDLVPRENQASRKDQAPRKDPPPKENPPPELRTASPPRDSNPAMAKPTLPKSTRVSAPDRRAVFERADRRCEFIGPDGEKCGSRFLLEVEHRIPRALGGSHEPANLEVLCRDHNLIRGIRVFGPDRMRRN